MSKGPSFNLNISLNDIFEDEDGWGDSLGKIIREEIERTLAAAVREAIKNDPNYKELVRTIKAKAYKAALGDITIEGSLAMFGGAST